MPDLGALEFLFGGFVAALFLVGLVWGPLYAIVFRVERRRRAEEAAERTPVVDVTSDDARARFGRQFEADMHELARLTGAPARMVADPGYAASPPFLGLPYMMDPTGPASLTSFGFHAMDRDGIGGEIAC